MEKLTIYSSQKNYNVFFSNSFSLIEKSSDFYLVDANIYSLWRELWIDKKVFVLLSGEKCKNLEVYTEAIEWLEIEKAHRKSKLTVVGGGASLDCGGFVASTYLRGLEWNAVPTTLLSMVDSCIGGKVGINFKNAKNRIGQFYPPKLVSINDQWLNTLPKKDFQNGYAEIIKTAALIDNTFWEEYLNIPLLQCIERCLKYKKNIVEKDEFERNYRGERSFLNAGHTVAHGLETLYPGRYMHGEAVSIGLAIETEFGNKIGYSDPCFLENLREKLTISSLPINLPSDLNIDSFIKILLNDKKGDGTNLTFSIIKFPGECKLITGISPQLFKNFLNEKIGVDET